MGYRGTCCLCGTSLSVGDEEWHRELGRCPGCGLNARLRGIILALSLEVYGDPIVPLANRDDRKDVRILGVSDSEDYASLLAEKFQYLNTYFHQEPRLDICDPDACLRHTGNHIVICSDVIEHTRLGPVAVIRNQLSMLDPGGALILTAPTFDMDESIEWYGALESYGIEQRDGRFVVRWQNLRGQEFVDEEPIFHGGAGATVELRLLAHKQLLSIAARLGAVARVVEFQPDWGYSWPLISQFSYLGAPADGRAIVFRKQHARVESHQETRRLPPILSTGLGDQREVSMQFEVDAYLQHRGMSAEEFQLLLDERGDWFHHFEFSNGCVARGRDLSTAKLLALQLPPLAAKTVADVGAYDGYFSFQAEKLGAAQVTAMDHFVWKFEGSNARGNFELIREATGSNIQDITISVEDTRLETVGAFDVTLFLGVLYHAPNMIEYLRNMRAITRELLVVETLVDLLDVPQPAAAYYPFGSMNNDGSNWWGPNIACVTDMLSRVGFRSVVFKGLWHLNTIAAVRGATPNEASSQPIRNGRAVFHAYV